ncbi:MAG: O-methyltransferase [Fimbriimonas sp.]|nr:O-methyltransferase [Fimbriimonas sp.]
MNQEKWTLVDEYFNGHLVQHDASHLAALDACHEAGLPAIQVAPNQGKLLQLLAMTQGARNILEIGTLGGYSTIWLAGALPSTGRLITLEFDPRHAEVAAANIERAGFGALVEVIVGRAADSLPKIAAMGLEPFDLVFIDADKASNPIYFEWALKLTKQGSLIIVDNVVRNGSVANPETTDPDDLGVRRFAEMAAAEPRVTGTVIQTVGSKGYDGLAILRVQ